jgi:hypothetical protein
MKKLSKILLLGIFASLPLFAQDETSKEEPKPITQEESKQAVKEELKDDSEVLFIPGDEVENYDDEGKLINNEEAIG